MPACPRLEDASPPPTPRPLQRVTEAAVARFARIATWARGVRPELWGFGLIILVLNLRVLEGLPAPALAFQPAAVRHGEWWRLFTYPFVHVTWYHLLLDGSAFLMLYHGLLERRLACRLLYVVAAGAGSLGCAWITTDLAGGLCGLSGIAHGLMAISAIELVAGHPPGSPERRLGWWSFGIVVVKAGFEALSGRMFFAFLDFGLLGNPIAVSHAGGVVGGLVAMMLLRSSWRSAGWARRFEVRPVGARSQGPRRNELMDCASAGKRSP